MPLSSFPGQRNWGYDGVLAYAPTQVYGRPEELKQLIESAHARNLMVFLDVVYNHFGPEGNYLHLFAPQFFTNCRHTPWGPAINFDGPKSRAVRDFFIHNALYWLEEFHFDGLRLDAVHAIVDDSRPDILTELSETVRNRFGSERQIHLILENDHNAAHYLCDGNGRDTGGRINPGRGLAVRDADASLRQGHPPLYDAQWNDDIHHAMQVLLTGESSRYYMDYAANPIQHLGRCLAEGFSYQGEVSRFRNGALRGEPSRDLPPTRFVSFLQNHDQVGNRALGERIVEVADLAAIKVVSTVFLLAPSPPLIFMGEEFAAATPFLFFCDFGPDLAAKVSEGRRKEFPDFTQRDSSCLEIPDPNDEKTFLRSKLDWASALELHRADWLKFYQGLLRVRREEIVPRIREIVPGRAEYKAIGTCGLRVRWALRRGGYLEVVANFGRSPLNMDEPLEGRLLCGTLEDLPTTPTELPSHTAVWLLA